MLIKINLGAGSQILQGYLNHDLVSLPGINVVHNLNEYPWPWDDSSVDEFLAYDVLEHLDDLVLSLEEIYRILKPGGLCRISVPYWNSWCAQADPTHKRGFHEITFRFFDVDSVYCRDRPYYTKARFYIVSECFVLAPFTPYFTLPGCRQILIHGKLFKKLVSFIANTFISNLILDLRVVLQKVTVDPSALS